MWEVDLYLYKGHYCKDKASVFTEIWTQFACSISHVINHLATLTFFPSELHSMACMTSWGHHQITVNIYGSWNVPISNR